jgi:hypothetical protein
MAEEALTRVLSTRGGRFHRHAATRASRRLVTCLSRGWEAGEGLQSFQPQKFRREKSKERPLSCDRSFNPCLQPSPLRGLIRPN